MNRAPFGEGEWYHCFNRGVDKRTVFNNKADYERFLMLLYVANDSVRPIRLGEDRQGSTLPEVLSEEIESRLVEVGAYCLMGNHFHLLIRERVPGGISAFMRKVSTGYTMYFNKKNERTGPLFSGRFKSRHVSDDAYFKRVINYIHANPAEMVEPGWKQGIISSPSKSKEFLRSYHYSSLPDYLSPHGRLESKILQDGTVLEYYEDRVSLSLESLLEDARTFSHEHLS